MYVAIAVIAVSLLAGLIYYWRYRSTRQLTSPSSAVQANIPKDVVFADENQMNNLTIEPVAARDFTIDREVTGKVGFNENRLTPVFPAYSGRVIQALATKGERVRKGQPLLVVESPDYVAAQNDLATARGDVDKAAVNLKTAEVNADRAPALRAGCDLQKRFAERRGRARARAGRITALDGRAGRGAIQIFSLRQNAQRHQQAERGSRPQSDNRRAHHRHRRGSSSRARTNSEARYDDAAVPDL
jgi:multidrug resistance efflux pump